MPGFGSAAIDQFANKLWGEETYYLNLMSTPHLWSEKKTTYVAVVNRHLKSKRVILKDITGSRTITHHSTTTSTTTTTSLVDKPPIFDVNDGDDDALSSPFDKIVPVVAPLQPSPTESTLIPLPFPPSSTVHPFFQSSGHKPSTNTPPPRLDIPANVRCKCGQYKINQACSAKLCQKCCSNSMEHCLITSHLKNKPPGYQATKYKPTPTPTTPLPEVLPGVVDHLAKAMKEGREIYIAYTNHNANEKQARKVKPLQWIRFGEAFKAFCFIDDMEKTFNTHKILRIEDKLWPVAPEGN
jgi:hypothetical protein